LERILATGCPDSHVAALLREIADRLGELRATRGTARLYSEWLVKHGRPMEPEAVTQTRKRLLTSEPS
jgi:hypothetical protein